MNKNIIEEIRKFVEEECKKPTNQYTFEVFTFHIIPVNKYARKLAEELGADLEIVELAAWLHDIGLVMLGRENHHITGAEIAEKKLKELGYPEEKIEKVKHCILAHRGSKNIELKSVEARIIAEADSIAHFDTIGGLFKVNFSIQKEKDQGEITEFIRQKYINSYNQLSPESKELVRPKYEAAMLLLGENE